MQSRHGDLEHIIAVLSATSLCDGLDAEQLAVMAEQLESRPFVAGETLAESGDPVTEFWIVAEGDIDAFATDAHGRESLMGTVHQGETVGEIAILEKSIRPVRFTARTHGTLLVAPAEVFHTWLDAYSSLMKNLFRTLSGRYKRAMGIVEKRLPAPRLGIVAPSRRGQLLAARLAARLLAAGERWRVWSDKPEELRAAGPWPEALSIETLSADDQPLLEAPSPDIDRRVVVWTPGSDLQIDMQRLLSCDEVLWMLEPSDAAATSQHLRRVPTAQNDLAEKARIVWLLNSNTPVAPLLSGWGWQKADLKVPVETNGDGLTRLERQGLDRLVRTLRGISIGIALAGGGAKGMAHLGALRALEQAGITFDAMSGTSAGAMAGILYASGMSPESAVENFQRDLTPGSWFQLVPKWPNWYLLSQFRRRMWEAKLRRYLYDWRLEQLLIPFYSVTVDLVQVRPVVRHEHDAVHAILESINLPVVSQPILRDGMVLVDGGILNNLPADVLVERGVDFVVGVDVSSRVRPEFAGNRPDLPTNKMRPAGVLDTMFRIFEAQAHNIGNIRNRAVDFWITPDTSGFGLAEFHRTAEIAAAGEAAAKQKLPELQKCLVELEQRLLGLPRKT